MSNQGQRTEQLHQSYTAEQKCTDIFYLTLCSGIFIGILLYSIIALNIGNLIKLGKPVTSTGELCPSNSPYMVLDELQPTLSNRYCSVTCPRDSSQSMKELIGGLCISDRLIYILQMNEQFPQYIQPKINSLNRIKMLQYLVLFSFVISLIYYLVCRLLIAKQSWRSINFVSVIMPALVNMGGLYFLFERIRQDNKLLAIQGYLWVIFCLLFIFYIIGVLVWFFTSETNLLLEIQENYLRELAVIAGCNILGIILMALVMFEFLAIASSSNNLQWQSPKLFFQLDMLSYKLVIVLLQGVYLMSFTFSACEYLLGGCSLATSQKLPLSTLCWRMLFNHLGSVHKSAIINLTFFFPIQLFMLIKPQVDTTRINECMHCFCGYLFNISSRYNGPVLAYQASCKNSINLSNCSYLLYLEASMDKNSYVNFMIYKLGAIIFLISINICGIVLFHGYFAEIETTSMIFGVVLGFLIGGINCKGWSIVGWLFVIRKICMKNRIEAQEEFSY